MRFARAPLVLAPVALLCAAAAGFGSARPTAPARVVEARTAPAQHAAGLERAVAGARAVFPGPYEARLVSVVDGDTFRARLGVWFGQEVETLVRLRRLFWRQRAARTTAHSALRHGCRPIALPPLPKAVHGASSITLVNRFCQSNLAPSLIVTIELRMFMRFIVE